TGLTVIDVTKVSKLLLIWRSLMQYFGGAGFAIIASSIIGPIGFGFYHAEGRTDNLLPNVKKSAKMIIVIYGTYALAGIIMYLLAGMNFFDAFNHSLTALSTGGFSTKVNSIGEFNSKSIEFVTIILMILGTTGFGVHFTLWKGDFKTFLKNPEPWLLFSLILFFTPFVTVNLSKVIPIETLRHSLFQNISALTSTGFSTVSFNNWPGFSMMALILLMIIGGGMDSTAGGLKLYRVFVLLKLIVIEVTSFFLPKNVVRSYVVWKGNTKRFIDESTVKEILLMFTLYFLTYITGVMILLGYGYDVLDSLFEFASALSTVGLSVGITSPSAPAGVLWTETMGMFFGRLEFMVILYALAKIFRDVDILLSERRETRRGNKI
ncbi:MAG: trk/ktr system potassium uptake protein, partial [Thermotogaceae bacterium]|nr:trk/ktr system potassium uptake protein [Thermotogaceae bacterium]